MISKILATFFPQIKEVQELIKNSEQQAKEIILKANEEALKVRQDAEREARAITKQALDIERRLEEKERQINAKFSQLDQSNRQLEQEREKLVKTRESMERAREQILQKLETVANMTKAQAADLLMQGVEDKMKAQIANRIRKAEAEIKENIEEKSRNLMAEAMRFGASDYVAEYTLSVFNLPSEDYKGRIIGKDGRNIRAFELATGVDIDLEEEGVIKLSSFDAVRREIARLSLAKLIRDGRIQPQRIEEIVKKTREEVDKIIAKAGEDLTHRFGVYNLPKEIVHLLGRFKYRYSYGQNMILHTIEETKIGIALAKELKADSQVVKLGCLLHDIGKVIDDKEGNHVELGVRLLEKYCLPKEVIDTVATHHEDSPFTSVEGVIVYIADAISSARPGARHEDLDDYFKRIKKIEEIAKAKPGVREAYALQAGRELRVIVSPQEISDDDAVILANKIREDLEKEFEVFPGQIKVTVIRDFRAEAVTRI